METEGKSSGNRTSGLLASLFVIIAENVPKRFAAERGFINIRNLV